MTAGPEVTPRCRAAIVSLHHPQIGINLLSFRDLTAVLGVPKSICSDIYKHAIKNAAAKRLVETEAASASVPARTADESASGSGSEDADVFLKGIDTQLDSVYTVPGEAGDLKEDAHGMLQFVSYMKIHQRTKDNKMWCRELQMRTKMRYRSGYWS